MSVKSIVEVALLLLILTTDGLLLPDFVQYMKIRSM
jgi:hypothetical protein